MAGHMEPLGFPVAVFPMGATEPLGYPVVVVNRDRPMGKEVVLAVISDTETVDRRAAVTAADILRYPVAVHMEGSLEALGYPVAQHRIMISIYYQIQKGGLSFTPWILIFSLNWTLIAFTILENRNIWLLHHHRTRTKELFILMINYGLADTL